MGSPSKTTLPYTVVDAFTTTVFGGNPAAIVITESPPDDATLQLIAREFNLSETCFVTPWPSSEKPRDSVKEFSLRWFTPLVEIDLCGHGTLASAHALFNSSALNGVPVRELHFHTRSGVLVAQNVNQSGKIELVFPAGAKSSPLSMADLEMVKGAVKRALGEGAAERVTCAVRGTVAPFSTMLLIEVEWEDPEIVRRGKNSDGDESASAFHSDVLKELRKGDWLARIHAKPGAFVELTTAFGTPIIIITSRPPPGSPFRAKYHFTSRVFGPTLGVPEDPVCGSAHCFMGPYWESKERVNWAASGELKTSGTGEGGGEFVMVARQTSPRGGDLEVVWDKAVGLCRLRGYAVTATRGELFL